MRANLRSGITLSLTALFITCSTTIQSQPKPIDAAAYREIIIPENATTGPAEDAMDQFSKTYPLVLGKLLADFKTINDLKYSVSGNHIYLRFKNNGRGVSAVYSRKGKMRYSIIDLGQDLPGPVYERIGKEYPGYTVFYGRHIKTKTDAVYHIILENQSGYRALNLMNGEMEEVKSIKK